MKSMGKGFLSAFLMLLLLFTVGVVPQTAGAASEGRPTVLIDPGHGGDETGVVADKIREKDLNLQIALLVRQEAQKAGQLQIHLTRSADRAMTIAERIKVANDIKPDCVVSLHANAGFGKKAEGYEVYFPGFQQSPPPKGDANVILKDMAANRHLNDSVRLAQEIQSALGTVFPRKGRGLRDAPSPLLEGLNIPGLVVEVGFATQPEERKQLTDVDKQRAIARALIKGLRDYFQKAPQGDGHVQK